MKLILKDTTEITRASSKVNKLDWLTQTSTFSTAEKIQNWDHNFEPIPRWWLTFVEENRFRYIPQLTLHLMDGAEKQLFQTTTWSQNTRNRLLKALNGVPAWMLFSNEPISARPLQHLDADWSRVLHTKIGRGIALIKKFESFSVNNYQLPLSGGSYDKLSLCNPVQTAHRGITDSGISVTDQWGEQNTRAHITYVDHWIYNVGDMLETKMVSN